MSSWRCCTSCRGEGVQTVEEISVYVFVFGVESLVLPLQGEGRGGGGVP